MPLLPAHFVGCVLATIFYGITLAQAFAYYREYTTDPRHMKLIVALLLFLDTSQVFLTLTSVYDYTIRLRGDETALQYVSRPFSASMAVTCVVAFTVQMIYAYRVWRLSAGNAYLTTSILALAFVALGVFSNFIILPSPTSSRDEGSGTAMTAKTIRNPRWDETRVSNLPAGIILASTVTCDLLIASAQVWLFHRHRLKRGKLFSFPVSRRRTAPPSPATDETRSTTVPTPLGGSSRRGSLLTGIAGIAGLAGSWRLGSGPGSTVTAEGDKEEHGTAGGCDDDGDHDGCRLGALLTTLTVLVVNVGLLTSMDATLFLVLFLVCPSNGTFLVPYILLSNCYVNSFLSMYVSPASQYFADHSFIPQSFHSFQYFIIPPPPSHLEQTRLNSRRILRDLVENPEHFPVTFDFALDTG
ncbi:hypothetical protein C8F04DRAFT_1260126 [Mycena alexandri]|uniref:Uncharacterized protein n=1 Tax=Mycena alexandri TaxID=1745969 RepID=A0AAD6SWP7_9AGAR|nr:hypothetical protein C8F04DRAFT_1260126 [Mycena alexandri]